MCFPRRPTRNIGIDFQTSFRCNVSHPVLPVARDCVRIMRRVPRPLMCVGVCRCPSDSQAQVLVAISSFARKTMGQNLPPEQVMWAGTPHLRTATILYIFLVWSLTLVVPVLLLVELVDDIAGSGVDGGWLSLGWAIISVFIFVPKARCSVPCGSQHDPS